VPGQYAALHAENNRLEIVYRFAQQDGLPEENTCIDLINRDNLGVLRVAESIHLLGKHRLLIDLYEFRKLNPDTVAEYAKVVAGGDTRDYLRWLEDYLDENPNEKVRPGILGDGEFETNAVPTKPSIVRHVVLPMPRDFTGSIYALVRPGTHTKLGPVYPSNEIEIHDPNAVYGAVRLRLKFPNIVSTGGERLLTLGSPSDGSLLYMESGGDNRSIVLGYTDGRRINIKSTPVSLSAESEHELEFSAGSLYPSRTAGGFSDLEERTLPALSQQLWVKVDGKLVMSAPFLGSQAPWKTLRFGKDSADLYGYSTAFTGVLGVERFWPTAPEDSMRSAPARMAAFGALKLRVKLPIGQIGLSEPLVTTGETRSGDFVYVSYTDAKHIRIGFDHWGVKGFTSKPLEIDYSKAHEIDITMGSLYPPDGDILFGDLDKEHIDAFKGKVTVLVDGAIALDGSSTCYDSPPAYVTVGRNDIGGSTTGPVFTGEIAVVGRTFNP
jgi:hypothetical protein